MFTDKSHINKFSRSTWCKEDIGYKYAISETKPQIQEKQVDKNRPKLGRGRAGMQVNTHNLLLTL